MKKNPIANLELKYTYIIKKNSYRSVIVEKRDKWVLDRVQNLVYFIKERSHLTFKQNEVQWIMELTQSRNWELKIKNYFCTFDIKFFKT